jgi:hypothetical protein
VKLDLSTDQAVDAQTKAPGNGLYGPDGRFVESSARRELNAHCEAERRRDLVLAGFDSIIPPAAREELLALADRVQQAAVGRRTDPRQLRQIARLMDMVGRYDEANRALVEAEELEHAAEDEPSAESPRPLDAARAEAVEQ